MGLDYFHLTNVSFSSGKLTATVNYAVSLGNLDTLSNTKIRVFYYDNSSTRNIDFGLSNTTGTFPITLFTTGPYLTISGQELAGPTTLTGNVLSGGTYYPTSTAPPNTGGSGTVTALYTIFGITASGDNTLYNFEALTTEFNKLQADQTAGTLKGTITTIYRTEDTPSSNVDTEATILPFINSKTASTGPNHAVTLRSISGATKSFVISASDDTLLNYHVGQPDGFITTNTISILSDITVSTAVNSTLNDIGTWLASLSASTGGTTGNPSAPIPIEVFDIRAIDGTVGTYVLSPTDYNTLVSAVSTSVFPYFDGQNRVTISNAGLTDSTNTRAFNLLTSLGNVNNFLTQHQTIAPPPQPNYAYNIQIPNVANALRLVTATNYGTTASISFPAQSFVRTILNQTVSTIPNTLNALFITKVADTPNEVQVANALIGYFPVVNNPPPQPPGPKRSIIEIAGGIFAGLLTLSLITGGSLKKGKR